MGLQEVSTTLWQERNLLELLLFKLEEEQLLLAAGRTRWLARATREVEVVLERIREAEIMRAIEVDVVAPTLLLQPGPSLQQLAESAPSPWDTMFHDHRQAFLELTEEITSLAAANRELVARGQRATQDFLANFVDPVSTTSGYPMDTQRERTPLVLDRAF
jgi:hypothetical protein